MQKPWTICCDGACAKDGRGPCSWGAVIADPSGSQREYRGVIEDGDGMTAEIAAAIESLRRVPAGASVTLFTNNESVAKGLREWIKSWQRRAWRTSSGKPVANKELWLELLAEYSARNVSIQLVRGNGGHQNVALADKLARLALKIWAGEIDPLAVQ